MARWILAFGAFVAIAASTAVLLAILFGVSSLWFDGGETPSWLFATRDRGPFGPSSPADLMLVFLSAGAGLVAALIVLSRPRR